jgi:diguanylate cyclase (GGDEF)-like protein/PAS domain S-box-containing protein
MTGRNRKSEFPDAQQPGGMSASSAASELARLYAELKQQQADRERVEQALRDSEERYRLIAETATDAIVTIDDQGTIVFANPASEKVFGYAPAELIGRNMTALMPDGMRQAQMLSLERHRHSGAQQIQWQHLELCGLHKDGHELPLEISFGEFQRDGKQLFIGTIRDITYRKKADSLRIGQGRVLEMVATGAPVKDVLTELTRFIETQSDGMLCSILLLDDDRVHLRHGAAPSLPAAYIEAIDGIAIGPNVGSCGTAAYRGEPVVVADIQADPLWADYRELAATHGLRACWSTPIMSQQQKVLGTFAMYYGAARSPTTAEQRLIEIAIQIAGIAIERERAEERIRFIAQHDALTGLPNRLLFRDRVEQAISQAHRNKQQVAVLFIDLDHFKDINDSLGHQTGDRLLCATAHCLQRCLREGDSVARLGGDEFVICLPALNDSHDSALVAGKILEAVREGFHLDSHTLHVTGSVGISLFPENGKDAEELMRAADAAMYHAKEKGRDNYQFFMPRLNEAAQRRLSIAGRLRNALQRDEFVLHYQPQMNLASGSMFSAEALIRWQTDAMLVPPNEFIKIAEETGLIAPLGEWVLRQACEQVSRWRGAGHPDMRVTVNLSPQQLRRPGFAEFAKRVLAETALPAEALEIEITEGLLMNYSQENVTALGRLARMGVRLAVDDFGTGYSSLAYLQRFPISVLKIDQSFVSGIGMDPNDTAIVSAIIAMADSLQLKVIAEGVETAEQAAFLKSHGCFGAQGYYYSKAVTAEQFSKLFDTPHNPASVS